MTKEDKRSVEAQYNEICASFDNDLSKQERKDILEQIVGVNYHLELNDILRGI